MCYVICTVRVSMTGVHALSRARLSATPRTVARQAPLSVGYFRQEYQSRLPFPPPGDLPGPGVEPLAPVAPALQVDSLPLSRQGGPQISSTGSWTIGAVLHGLK